jgi:hypothetical protein
MSGRVDAATSNAGQITFEAEVDPCSTTNTNKSLASAKSESPGSTVESWSGSRDSHTSSTSADAGPCLSAMDLGAQVARDQSDRQRAKSTILSLEGPMKDLASDVKDPFTASGPHFTFAQMNELTKQFTSDTMKDAAGRLSNDDVAGLMYAQVRRAWPDATLEQKSELANHFTKRFGDAIRDGAAFKMKSLAVEKFRSTAKSFTDTAKDPQKLQSLSQKFTSLDSKGQQAFRDGFGLAKGSKVTPETLALAMNGRAALLEKEAVAMEGRGTNTLFRELTRHDLREPLMKEAGIKPGSFAASQVDAVKQRGEAEEKTIEHAKLASALGVAVFTGGMGMGGLAAFGTSAAMSAPDVMLAWNAIDSAKAGESAGTMKQGAADEAKNAAVAKTAIAAGAAVLGGVATGAGHHLTEKLATKLANVVAEEVVNAGVHGGEHYLLDKALETGLHPHASDGAASGKNALERLE